MAYFQAAAHAGIQWALKSDTPPSSGTDSKRSMPAECNSTMHAQLFRAANRTGLVFFFLVLTSKNLQRSTRTISNTQSHLSSAAMSHDDNDVSAGPESAARLLGRGRVIARQFRDRVSPSSRAPLAPHPLRSSTKRSNTRNTVKCHRQKALAPNQGDMCSCPLRGIKAQSAPPTCTY